MKLKINLQWKFTLYFLALVVGILLFVNFFSSYYIANQFHQFCETYENELPKCLHGNGGARFLLAIKWSLLWVGGIGSVAALALGYFFSRFLLKPIRNIISATKRISRGDYTVRIKSETNDEINELIDSLNDMSEDLGKIEKLRKELVANVSHELSTPLTNIYGYAEALADNVIKDEAKRNEAIRTIKSESERLIRLTKELKKLSLLDTDNMKLNVVETKISQLIKEAVESFKPKLENKEIEIKTELVNKDSVRIDEDKIRQVLANILDNAIRYSPRGGTIIIKTSRKEGWLALSVKDFGRGISSEDSKFIFERFYRADKSRSGKGENIGIGLTIAKKIVDLHGGKLEVKSEKNKGSEFSVFLRMNGESDRSSI